MKRLFIIGLMFAQGSYALFGSGSPIDKTIKEAKSVLSQVNEFCTAERKKLDKQGVTPAVLKQDLNKIASHEEKLSSSMQKLEPLLNQRPLSEQQGKDLKNLLNVGIPGALDKLDKIEREIKGLLREGGYIK